jgi:hypothetical protein
MKDSDGSTGASFDVHGLVGIEVDSGTPGGSELHDVLAPFLGASRAPLRLHFSGTMTPMPEQSHADSHYRFTEDSLYLPAHSVQIRAHRHGYAIQGRGELLSTLIPLLDGLCVRENVAMIHAVVLDYRGSGVLLPAWGGAVEPGTVARLVTGPGVRFMADDWAFLDADGMLLGCAKPMALGPHEGNRYPGVFGRLPAPLAPEWLVRSAAKLTASAQPMLERYPKGGALARRLSPPRQTVDPQQIFGPGRISSAALTRLAIFLERFDGPDARLEARSAEWMTSRIVGNFHSGLPMVSRLLIEALGATGLVPLEDYFGQKAAVARRALSEVPCFLLRLPVSWSVDRTSEYLADLVSARLEE